MASKVPKFGAWEGGENFTVYFDNARKTKTGGPRINPNDPEENPDLFRLNGYAAQAHAPSQTRADNNQRKQQTKVPHFGAWENEDTAAGYTACFENVRKNRNGGAPVAENEPQMNRDMSQAQTQGKAQAQAQGIRTKVETKGGKPKVPEFGGWESGEGGGGYTVVFDNLKKKHDHHKDNAYQSNGDVANVGPTPQDGRPKVPMFGEWEEGEGVQYTSYFDKPKQSKYSRPGGGQNSSEPHMNRDVGDSASSVSGSERQSRASVAHAPVHPRANNLQPRNGPTRGSQPASVPHFGSWNNDPSEAEEYTGAFARAKEDRHTPVYQHVPPPNHHRQPQPQPQRQPHSSKQKQPGCCTIM